MPFFQENKRYLISSFLVLALSGAFLGGYFFARSGYELSVAPVRVVNLNFDKGPQTLNWQILWDALEVINKKYVEKPIDQQSLLYGAVAGMVASLNDPYSVFFTPQQSEEFGQDLKGEFSGIGAEIGMRSGQLVVIAPLDGSPAETAGLKPLDAILEIDGESTEGVNIDDAVTKIRGPKGTSVALTLGREGETEPIGVAIVRDTIVVKSVLSEIVDFDGKKLGVIELRRFGEDTRGEMDVIIMQFLNQNIKGVVLDLRSNPGGYITSAVEVASNWLQEGEVVVFEQTSDGRRQEYPAAGIPRLSGLPTVVVVNEGSASASEIVAGALSDHGYAQIVGKKTFGKGSVQELVDLPEKTQVKITIARWLTPGGVNINEQGISPDIEVGLSEDDVDALHDPQREKALDILVEKLK